MTTLIDIAELERLDQICPKPWRHVVHGHEDIIEFKPGDYSDDITPGNAGLAVQARNALPELIASLKIAVEALKKYRGIAGSDCANSVTQYSVADEALAEIRKRVTYE